MRLPHYHMPPDNLALLRIRSTARMAGDMREAIGHQRGIERGSDTEFVRYLTKPVNVDELNTAIDQTLAMLDLLLKLPKVGQP